MRTTAPTERRRLGLDGMSLSGIGIQFEKVRYNDGPIAEAQRLAIAQVLEERGVDNNTLAIFLREKRK